MHIVGEKGEEGVVGFGFTRGCGIYASVTYPSLQEICD